MEQAIEHIFEAVGPDVAQERRRFLHLELDACEAMWELRATMYGPTLGPGLGLPE